MKNILVTSKTFSQDVLYQTYVQPYGIMFRVFTITDAQQTDNQIQQDQLWSNDDLKGKTLVYQNKTYICEYNKYCEVSKEIVTPYREVFACISLNKSIQGDGNYSDRMFFADRLGETYFSKYTAGNWSKHIKAFGSIYLYRWIIQPNTDLTTAPCLCMQNHQLLTNLTFDDPIYDEGSNWSDYVTPWVTEHNPVVQIDGPDTIVENQTNQYTITVINHDGTPNTDDHVYLVECKQGYAPNKEVSVINGTGNVRITALGLTAGDTLRFKINDKVWTGYAEKTINVVSSQ